MNRNALLGVTAALTACGGGGVGLEETRIQARWADNIAQVTSLRAAIEQCAKSNGGVIAAPPCDNDTDLKVGGFLPATYALPTTINLAAATVASGVITLTGTSPANSCVVSITPTVTAGPTVTWNYANTAGCGRLHTGVGT